MGLDMYLQGEKFLWATRRIRRASARGWLSGSRRDPAPRLLAQAPDLHGFIVNTFAAASITASR